MSDCFVVECADDLATTIGAFAAGTRLLASRWPSGALYVQLNGAWARVAPALVRVIKLDTADDAPELYSAARLEQYQLAPTE